MADSLSLQLTETTDRQFIVKQLNSKQCNNLMLQAVATNPNLTESIFFKIINHSHSDQEVLLLIIENKNVTPNVLYAILDDNKCNAAILDRTVTKQVADITMLETIIEHKYCNQQILFKIFFLNPDNRNLLIKILDNIQEKQYLCEKIIFSTQATLEVLKILIEHPMCNSLILKQIAQRITIINNPFLKKLIDHSMQNSESLAAIAMNPAADEDTMLKLLIHTKCNSAVLAGIIFGATIINPDQRNIIFFKVIEHYDCNNAILKKIINQNKIYKIFLAKVMMHPCCDDSVLEAIATQMSYDILAEDEQESMINKILVHENTGHNALLKLTTLNLTQKAIFKILEHQSCNFSTLLHLLNKKNLAAEILISVIRHSECLDEVIKKIIKHPSINKTILLQISMQLRLSSENVLLLSEHDLVDEEIYLSILNKAPASHILFNIIQAMTTKTSLNFSYIYDNLQLITTKVNMVNSCQTIVKIGIDELRFLYPNKNRLNSGIKALEFLNSSNAKRDNSITSITPFEYIDPMHKTQLARYAIKFLNYAACTFTSSQRLRACYPDWNFASSCLSYIPGAILFNPSVDSDWLTKPIDLKANSKTSNTRKFS